MQDMKHLNEFRYFKVNPSKDNVKDPNEPFFNEPKYDYKRRKEVFGTHDFSKKSISKIEIDESVIDDLLRNNNLSPYLNKILNKIKKQCKGYEKCKRYVEINGDDESTDDMWPDDYLTFQDLENDEIKKLNSFGFGIKIYDDSNEFSENFTDKCRVSWNWK